ncbi:MAG: hypothetical protein KMY54_09665, partial [Erysipelothrix sp.]|nr:hypothetical protein [Erysipelothrix sp.]
MKIDNATSPQFEYRYDASGNLAIVKDNVRSGIQTAGWLRYRSSPQSLDQSISLVISPCPLS